MRRSWNEREEQPKYGKCRVGILSFRGLGIGLTLGVQGLGFGGFVVSV